MKKNKRKPNNGVAAPRSWTALSGVGVDDPSRPRISAAQLFAEGQLTEEEYKLLEAEVFTTLEVFRRIVSLRAVSNQRAGAKVYDLFYGLELGVISPREAMDRLRVYLLTGYLYDQEVLARFIEEAAASQQPSNGGQVR